MKRTTMVWALAATLLAGAAYYIFWPLHALVRGWNDFGWVYAAGRNLIEGASPYDIERWRSQWTDIVPSFMGGKAPSQPFMYPPHWALIAVPFASMPWPVSMRLWDMVNIVSCLGLLGLCINLVAKRDARWIRDPWLWVFVALACYNGAMRWALWECQMSLLPTLGAVGAFWAWHEKKTALLAVFAFIAALKPQIAIVPLVFLFLNGGHAGILIGAVAALAVSAAALVPYLHQLPEQAARSYELHMAIKYNAPSYFFNLSALLASFALGKKLLFVSAVLGMGAAAFLTALRRWPEKIGAVALAEKWGPLLRDPAWLCAMVLALGPAFVPLHGYDLVMYTPLVILCCTLRPRWLAAAIVTMVMIAARAETLGERLHLSLGPLPPWFTVGAAVLCALSLPLSTKTPQATPAVD